MVPRQTNRVMGGRMKFCNCIMALNLVGWNVVLDSNHADELSAFYEKLLGWTRFKGEEYTVLVNLEQTGTPTWITIQQVDDYVPPVWPATVDA